MDTFIPHKAFKGLGQNDPGLMHRVRVRGLVRVRLTHFQEEVQNEVLNRIKKTSKFL